MQDTVKVTIWTDWPEFAELGIEGHELQLRAALADKGWSDYEIVDRTVKSTGKFLLNGHPVEVEGPDIVFITAVARPPLPC